MNLFERTMIIVKISALTEEQRIDALTELIAAMPDTWITEVYEVSRMALASRRAKQHA